MKEQKNIKRIELRKIKQVWMRNISGWLLIAPSVILFVLLVWRPIIIGISYSFFDLKGFAPVKFVGFDNYIDVLTDTNFLQTLKNTVWYVFWSLIIGFPLPFICAVILNELIHTKGWFRVSTYLPVLVPSIASMLIWKLIYQDGSGGLLNMFLYYIGIAPVDWLNNKALVIPELIISMTWHGFGGAIILYLATLQGVDNSLYDAARVDGVGLIGRFTTVLFPHMRSLLLLNVIRQMISVFNVTEQPLAMTGGGPNGASMSLGLTNYFYAFKFGQYEKSLALGVITFVILMGLTFVYFYFDKKTEV